ncbi:sigma-54 interaction domain-containing protein [Maledivibacter halophilus]|uniref:Arginine utilization regulatory protein n=1 Tax=Maledivibacter halophilus TaxID=36842 RepID=A0A1T5M9X4_9FIRM|nr:sigma 54-interacting transcriptional regulator [Maledivibacter halophilus]SKC84903.1 arginine utilization regulatory protein [Maledivibacter halophilus]
MDHKFLLEAILTHLDEGILVVDNDANVTFYNEPATSIAGISKEEAIGKNILEIFPDLDDETSSFYHVLKTKEPMIDYVQTYSNYQGRQVTTVTSTIPLLKEGRLVGALEMYRPFDCVKELSEKVLALQKELFKKNTCKNEYKGNGTHYTFDDIIGENIQIKELKKKATKIADSLSPILVYGETGTGKELLVQGIHNASIKRRNKPFIAQNCAAIPNSLLEGILFGTSLGSFTGAKDKPGLFELADGGTLFLDEINSMDIELQAKLLRVLQDGVIRRVGGKKTLEVDVRVITSTNEDPVKVMQQKRLRKDLYYRLNVIALDIPPLRERMDDIEILVKSFIELYNKKLNKNVLGLTEECMDAIKKYNWPGNVRELKYTIESIMNFAEGKRIEVDNLPSHIKHHNYNSNKIIDEDDKQTYHELPPLKKAISQYEKKLVIEALERSDGNCAEAARMLKVPRQTLHNKVKKYDIKIKYKVEYM